MSANAIPHLASSLGCDFSDIVISRSGQGRRRWGSFSFAAVLTVESNCTCGVRPVTNAQRLWTFSCFLALAVSASTSIHVCPKRHNGYTVDPRVHNTTVAHGSAIHTYSDTTVYLRITDRECIGTLPPSDSDCWPEKASLHITTHTTRRRG